VRWRHVASRSGVKWRVDGRGGAGSPTVEETGADPDPPGRIPPAMETYGGGACAMEFGTMVRPRWKRLVLIRPEGKGGQRTTTPGEFITIYCCWTTFYDC